MNVGIEGNMEFFRMARNFCFGLAIAFALLAVLTFILFDIKTIFQIKTGRAQRRTISEMNERNQQTGKLRRDTEKERGKTRDNIAGMTVKKKAEKTKKDTGKQPIPQSSSYRAPVHSGSEKAAEGAAMKTGDDNAPVMVTSLLSDHERGRGEVFSRGFRVTKRIIVTHTDENIAV